MTANGHEAHHSVRAPPWAITSQLPVYKPLYLFISEYLGFYLMWLSLWLYLIHHPAKIVPHFFFIMELPFVQKETKS